jgi:signal transduction histidine kinase
VDVQPTSRREQVVDALIAAGFACVSVALTRGLVDDTVDRVFGYVLGIAHTAPLAVRRRWPIGVTAVMVVTALLTVPLGLPAVLLGPAITVALYTVGERVAEARSRRVLVGVLGAMTVVVLANRAGPATVVSDAVVLAVAWWLGDRARRAALAAEEQRAAAAVAAQRAAVEERMRIARELHDVVAHSMSAIAVLAGTGRFVMRQSPDVAAEALGTIETTSRAALEELRRLLAVLRDDSDPEQLAPTPGLADLDALVGLCRDAGIDVDVTVAGAQRALPAGLDLCAFRIVQEALTNVRKHARARRASVSICYEPAALTVTVRDDGVGPRSGTSGGHGLVGMSERVSLYGGTLHTGRGALGGYEVVARLPAAEGT